MTNFAPNDLELASPEVVRQAAHAFAASLAETPQYMAFERAAEQFRQDEAAQHAWEAYQSRQQSLQVMQQLNALSAEEQAELERLHQAFMAYPSVVAYFQAQADLKAVCQAAADLLSERIGLNFAAACSSGCC